ncbi:hypothetical protein, partial [Xylella fastidiosa]|uniref:hypothetical protein n=1 Tax=Xylella fastidiosa TaxID=2371 RepID=UPI001930F9F8
STLFTAEFMGSNNRLDGKVTEVRDGQARIEGRGWALWGKAGEGVTAGQDATAVIRVDGEPYISCGVPCCSILPLFS